jgi:hypothetical protein
VRLGYRPGKPSLSKCNRSARKDDMSEQGNFLRKPFWARIASDAVEVMTVTATNPTAAKETTMKPRTIAVETAAAPVVRRESVVRHGPVRSPFLTTKEAATYLRMSPRTIERLRVEGKGPPYRKCGRGKKAKVLYAIGDLDAWLGDVRSSTSEML